MSDFTGLILSSLPYLFVLFGVIVGGFYLVFYGLIYGAMYMRLPKQKLKKIIQLGQLSSGKSVADLGCGYGRIMFEAAKSGASVVGYDVDPVKAVWVRAQITKKMLGNVAFVQGNLLDADLRTFDVVYCYLSPLLMEKIAAKEFKLGALLISVEHPVKSWAPCFEDAWDKIYAYKIRET